MQHNETARVVSRMAGKLGRFLLSNEKTWVGLVYLGKFLDQFIPMPKKCDGPGAVARVD